MSAIIDRPFILENINLMAGMIDGENAIKKLKKDVQYWQDRADKNPNKAILKKLDEAQNILDAFTGLINLLQFTYKQSDAMMRHYERQKNIVNNGADILDLLEDLKQAYNLELQENTLLGDILGKVINERTGVDAEKIKKYFSDWMELKKKYLKFLNSIINKKLKQNGNST